VAASDRSFPAVSKMCCSIYENQDITFSKNLTIGIISIESYRYEEDKNKEYVHL
jgi:hypothetical protein